MWDEDERDTEEWTGSRIANGMSVMMMGLLVLGAFGLMGVSLMNVLADDGLVPMALLVIALAVIFHEAIVDWFRMAATGRRAKRETRELDEELRNL